MAEACVVEAALSEVALAGKYGERSYLEDSDPEDSNYEVNTGDDNLCDSYSERESLQQSSMSNYYWVQEEAQEEEVRGSESYQTNIDLVKISGRESEKEKLKKRIDWKDEREERNTRESMEKEEKFRMRGEDEHCFCRETKVRREEKYGHSLMREHIWDGKFTHDHLSPLLGILQENNQEGLCGRNGEKERDEGQNVVRVREFIEMSKKMKQESRRVEEEVLEVVHGSDDWDVIFGKSEGYSNKHCTFHSCCERDEKTDLRVVDEWYQQAGIKVGSMITGEA
ncbi:hypothetical protein L873DRAFT_1790417 [Choiromyces venosus 120613-1]|uniref:Uncharacterized protein n=1 Tax=Choiromyces venosus 120613-1 TaxID=1336337 RepID=A0A3N4JNB0_9PEZI|nr:hypothetical protein L873DRAFT_1790417 [Choiromyces venosus 120613-1]